jgi:hypothetical protein
LVTSPSLIGDNDGRKGSLYGRTAPAAGPAAVYGRSPQGPSPSERRVCHWVGVPLSPVWGRKSLSTAQCVGRGSPSHSTVWAGAPLAPLPPYKAAATALGDSVRVLAYMALCDRDRWFACVLFLVCGVLAIV